MLGHNVLSAGTLMPDVHYTEQKIYWQGVAERRAPSHPAVSAFAKPKLDFIAGHIGTGLRMLEIGAGNGFLTHTFERAYALTAVDFSENMLRMNPLGLSRKVQSDAEHLPFRDGSFDVVLSANLLHHLEAPDVAVSEMRRVAALHVVLVEPNVFNPLMLAFGAIKQEERGSLKFTPAYLRALGKDPRMRLRAFTSLGAVVPNRTPAFAVPLLRHIDGQYPIPIGFYNIAIFDVLDASRTERKETLEKRGAHGASAGALAGRSYRSDDIVYTRIGLPHAQRIC